MICENLTRVSFFDDALIKHSNLKGAVKSWSGKLIVEV